MNKKNDNYSRGTPIDHSWDSELGIIQTKGCLYSSEYRQWSQNFKNEHNQVSKGFNFDILILYCASEDGKYIERLYIFPVEQILERTKISIIKNPSKGYLWYEEYRMEDEDILKTVNEIWKDIYSGEI